LNGGINKAGKIEMPAIIESWLFGQQFLENANFLLQILNHALLFAIY